MLNTVEKYKKRQLHQCTPKYSGTSLSCAYGEWSLSLSAMGCVVRCCTAINRAFNFVLSVVGLAVLGYGLFLLDHNAWAVSALPIGLAGWGGVIFLWRSLTPHAAIAAAAAIALCHAMIAVFLCNGSLLGYTFTHEDQVIKPTSMPRLSTCLRAGSIRPRQGDASARRVRRRGLVGVAACRCSHCASCRRSSPYAEADKYRRVGDDGYGDEEYNCDYVPPRRPRETGWHRDQPGTVRR